jgi:2-polyprenyl-3-methyl-5-hydroxy-6-metoxy-1,4-benzoquinol methylase
MIYVLIFFIVVTICISMYLYYNHILNKYFTVNGKIVYDYYLKHFIQIVSHDNYFMNYGLWDNDNQNLYKANKNLAAFMFDKANIFSKKKSVKILDVGCGYGEQDIDWIKALTEKELTEKHLTHDSHITAIDISEKQISEATERRNQNNISDKQLSFNICDAMKLDEQYTPGQFDVVFSLESAFHYSDRPKFFSNVNSVLHDDGIFVISDILLNKDYKQSMINGLFLKIFSDFLHIPKQNLIGHDEWKQQVIDAGFEIVEYNDITSQTFGPYYKHFMYTYFKNKNLPMWMADVTDNLFRTIQPFTYSVSTFKKSTFKKSGAKSDSNRLLS